WSGSGRTPSPRWSLPPLRSRTPTRCGVRVGGRGRARPCRASGVADPTSRTDLSSGPSGSFRLLLSVALSQCYAHSAKVLVDSELSRRMVMMPSSKIDRRSLVRRHNPVLTAAHPTSVLTVGNGDVAMTVDITGLQTLPAFHELVPDPRRVAGTGLD